ncbi:MAG: imidazole glycerol phosphate synthase subunit HisF [Thermoanaerobaculum sp.]|nr:imidazole glycerol phosphate synthase subunit HisF [Thermoanaerobaculum sp.]
MGAFRVIPCLDVDQGWVVKGVRFQQLQAMDRPVVLAQRYRNEGADELVILDVSASVEGRLAQRATVAAVAEVLDIPLTVGGGVRGVDDALELLAAGADKVAVNTAAVADPSILERLARCVGRQAVVLAIDARRREGGWEVVTHGGRRPTGRDALAWAREGVERGAGEILLTSVDQDGTGAGFDNALLAAVRQVVSVPIIASGGGTQVEDFVEAFRAGADAGLAASIFHRQQTTVNQLKQLLAAYGVPVRWEEAWMAQG